MLTSIDVRISRLYSPVSRQVQEIKGCLLLIFFKQQMPPVELLSSCYCYDFRQQFGYFSFAKGIKVSAILYCSTKSTQPCPRVCRFAAHFSGIYVVPLTSFSTYRKRLPNLCNVSWLRKIIRRIWANQKRNVVPLTSFSTYRKRLPNLSNDSWLRKIIRWILANQKRINILNE